VRGGRLGVKAGVV